MWIIYYLPLFLRKLPVLLFPTLVKFVLPQTGKFLFAVFNISSLVKKKYLGHKVFHYAFNASMQ